MKVFAVLFTLMFTLSCQQQTESTNKKITVDEYEQHLNENTTVIDVRTPLEFQSGHIDEAINIDISNSDFSQRIEALDKDEPVIVYCAVGGRSARAASILQEKGFKTIYDLEGGISSWQSNGKPIVK